MSFFGGYHKRRRFDDDDGFHCNSCGDWTTYDESGNCGVCDEIYCNASDCLFGPCQECDEHYCESCMGRCEACGYEIDLCSGCVEDHLRNCTSQSRAQRMLAAETHAVQEYEKEIQKIQKKISSQQAKLKRTLEKLDEAKKRKAEAERLVKESISSSSANGELQNDSKSPVQN